MRSATFRKQQVKEKILSLLFDKYFTHLNDLSHTFVVKINSETDTAYLCYKYLNHKFWSKELRSIPIMSRSISSLPRQYISQARELLGMITRFESTKRIIENYIVNALNICENEADINSIFPAAFEIDIETNSLPHSGKVSAFKKKHERAVELMEEQYMMTLLL